MESIEFEGQTRVLGVSQGYRGLAVRDEMTDPGDAPQDEPQPVMVSMWKPSPEECGAIMNGGLIALSVLGTGHPPVMIEVVSNQPKLVECPTCKTSQFAGNVDSIGYMTCSHCYAMFYSSM